VIILDTNVLSELMRPGGSVQVRQWLDARKLGDLFITAITRAEIERGLNLLPAGKRRDAYRSCADSMFRLFRGRCLSFGETAAILFGKVQAERQLAGRPITTEDAQIASIALMHKMALATRNTGDFERLEGLELINPWH
jgi:predicted nucleic acid-binding protein